MVSIGEGADRSDRIVPFYDTSLKRVEQIESAASYR
jgi:hypothetical protein